MIHTLKWDGGLELPHPKLPRLPKVLEVFQSASQYKLAYTFTKIKSTNANNLLLCLHTDLDLGDMALIESVTACPIVNYYSSTIGYYSNAVVVPSVGTFVAL